jgi:polyisoprenoid-binding protein YceI
MTKVKWSLDLKHSELGFKIRHLMISNVSGFIRDFKVEAETEGDDLSTAQIVLTAAMDSISTNNTQRDAHLRNADFFETDKHPELRFTSTRIEPANENTFKLYGDLTLKGITKPVQLSVEYSGITKDPWGSQRAGFMVTGKINRNDWGVSFNSIMETGGLGLGEEVKINSEIQLVKQAIAEPVSAAA